MRLILLQHFVPFSFFRPLAYYVTLLIGQKNIDLETPTLFLAYTPIETDMSMSMCIIRAGKQSHLHVTI